MRTVLFGVLSAAIAFSSAAVLHSQPSAAALTGRVTTGSGADARPVRRARVTLTGAGLPSPRAADTDTSGVYRFDRVPPGAFKVRVQKPGFIALDADAAPNATLTMTRGGAIEGVVTDGAGDPVWDVPVAALQMENGKPKPISQTRTDDLGRYRIHSLPPGDYFVEASTDRASMSAIMVMAGEKMPDVNRGYYPAAVAIEDARPVLVVGGRDATGVDVTFTPALPIKDPSLPPAPPRPDRNGTGRIAGVVADATTGKPIRAAQILLLPAPGQGPALTHWIRSDPQGRFEYTSLPALRYTLRFQSRRHVTLEYGQKRPGEIGTQIDLHDGEDFRADMKLPRGSAIEGTLLDEFGDPAPGMRVTLAQRVYAGGRSRVAPLDTPNRPLTDDRGHYRIPAIAPGDYYVVALCGVYADAAETGGFAPTYYPGADASGAAAVTIPFNADAPNASFALTAARTFSVSGTMVDADGKPVAGRGSLLLHTADRLGTPEFNIARAVTNADGSFVLRNVPQGQYALQGFAPPAPDYRGPMNLSAMSFGWLPVAIGDASLDGLVLKTTPGTSVRGRFVLEDTGVAPPKPGEVFLQSIPTEFDSAPVGGGPAPFDRHDDLTFELLHQNGVRRLMVNVSSPLWTFRKMTLNGIDVTDQPIDLRTKDVDGLEIVLTSKVARVGGGVTDDKGTIADYAVVIFASDPTKWPGPSRFVTLARPTQQGRFTTAALPPDDYLAIALPNGSPQEIFDPDFLQQLRPQATSFTLNEGETKTLELKLKRRP